MLLFLIFIFIPSILANDCEYFEKAVKYLGSTYQDQYSKVPNCCNLNGITCDNNQHITEIKISNIKEYGDDVTNAITEFENLQYLTVLELKNVNSNGLIPQSVFNLKNLKTLKISDNLDYIGVVIPDSFDNLINLETLDLSHNSLKGSFPKSICNLKKLKHLNLADNDLDGTLPYNCRNLKELTLLDLEGNLDLHGYVPLYPNLNSCNFDITDLCYLPDATCKSEDMDECTEAEIKSTNIENENPNPNSDEYENHSKSKESINESTIKYILIFIIVVIVIIGTICLFKKYDCTYQEDINNNYRYRPTERNTNKITVQRTQITELRLNYN